MPALPITPPQTVGPFFSGCLLKDDLSVLAGPDTEGEHIRIAGCVLDGDGQPVPDALVEIWQAHAHGRYNPPLDTRELPLDPAFTGFGRFGTDNEGRFAFETVKPGPVPFDEETRQAPHICVTVLARGLLSHLSTRLYFADDPANAADPVLQRVPPERRETLLAQPEPQPHEGHTVYRFDIVLQGERETVFFDW
jgi:protocatechuate 3,4-dioxygenase alpha subunit